MKNISVEKMVDYLQSQMNEIKRMEYKGYPKEIIVSSIEEMISCKEMVEALIGEPVNLRSDGRVTIGF